MESEPVHPCYVANCSKPGYSRGIKGVYCDDHWYVRRYPADVEEVASLRRTVADQAAEIERLREALRRYGMHHAHCATNVHLTSMPPKTQPCNCGLDKALAGGRDE